MKFRLDPFAPNGVSLENSTTYVGGGSSGIRSVVAGTNITVNNTDPQNPIISSTGGGGASPLTTKGDVYTYSTVDARLPVGANGEVLSSDSSTPTGLKWISAGGTGTVTSVGVSGANGIGVSGSPVTTNGVIALSLGAITPTSVAASGSVTGSNLSGTNTGDQDLSGLVPNTRTVNGKALSSNITLNQDDVGDGTTYKQYSQTEKTKLAAITGTNTGDQTITLTGDVTGSGTGSFATAIAAGAIINADVNASAAIGLTKLAATTISRALVSDGSGFITPATTTATEIGYVNGVTSAIQTQLNAKQATGNYITALTSDITASGPGSAVATLATVNSNVGSFTNASITVNAKGLITAASNGSAGITWTSVTGTSQAAAINNGYIANNAGLVTITLPSTAAVGSIVEIAGSGAGGWKLAQNASQLVNFGTNVTTTGTGGSLASLNRYDAVRVICIVANTTWSVISSQGNVTVV